MFRNWAGKLALAALSLAIIPGAQAQGRVRGLQGPWGPVIVRPLFGPMYGYGGYGYGGFGGSLWGPWGGAWAPYGYGPGYYGSYALPRNTQPEPGKIKFDTKEKNAQVYINGAYAGTVKEIKSPKLKEGDYDVELRTPSGETYKTRVYVSSGGTVKIKPEFGGDRTS